MPSSLAHGLIAVAGGTAVAPRHLLRPFLVTGAIAAIVPDVDAIGRLWGDGDLEWMGGHRGFTHSVTFAALAGVAAAAFTLGRSEWSGHRFRFGLFIAFAALAHGLLDTLTSIGAGVDDVQVLYPFSTRTFGISRHPINGPFSELFYTLLPLLAVTWLVCRRRGIPWPRRRRERPQSLLS